MEKMAQQKHIERLSLRVRRGWEASGPQKPNALDHCWKCAVAMGNIIPKEPCKACTWMVIFQQRSLT